MITQKEVKKIIEGYDKKNITIGVLGGHSALDVCRGAKRHGFKTIAVCQKGRDKTYSKYYKARNGLGCVDEVIILDKFSEITKPGILKALCEKNVIFVHNRYFWVYFDFKDIRDKFAVPIFGTRDMVELEERDVPNNQYYLLKKAGIRIPEVIADPKKIDRLVIVKVNEEERGYERAFFFAASYDDFQKKSKEMIKSKTITAESLRKAVIEEYAVGAHVNFNFFYSSITKELELMGTDTRRQTNLDGLLKLPADVQIEVLKHLKPKLIETGHYAVTVKESILEKAFSLGERFIEACFKEHPPGIIGPFALQGAVVADKGREDIVIFDVSFRIPGSPGTQSTPYSGYLYGDSISYGERIAMEIKKAIRYGRLYDVCS